MAITFREFTQIQFPVFVMDSGNWEEADGLLFCDGKLVDDKNQPGKTLGARRLQTPFKDKYELKHSIQYPNGLIKQPSPHFIDNNGTPFVYQKELIVPLKYYKINKIKYKDTVCTITVKGQNAPFTVPRPPSPENVWAGILHLHGVPWMLYEDAEKKLKDTRRKVKYG